MALLYHWRRENYAVDVSDLGPGADLPLEQNSETFGGAEPGETLWAFTRRGDGHYVLAARLVVREMDDQAGTPFEYGRYRVNPLPGTTVLYDVARGDDIEPLVRRLPIPTNAAVLGSSFQGPAAVRRLDAASDARLAAFATRQPVLTAWRRNAPPPGAERDAAPARDARRAMQESELAAERAGSFDPRNFADARRRALRSIVQRRGQPAFRRALLAAYGGRCAVTGCDAEAALEAAHIIPYQGDATNAVANGLLLRADVHTLFDLGLITVDPGALTVLVAPALSATGYADFSGRALRLPSDESQHPSALALAEHRRRSGV